jgi:uncharacterized membrane protein YcaP (DUF421 family)
MLTSSEPILNIVLRATLVYLAIFIGLRLVGKREVGQLTIFDLVVLLLLANSVQNAMVGTDSSVTGGVVAAATLLVLNTLFSYARLHSRYLRRLLEGSPTILVWRGKIITQNMLHEGIDEDMLRAQLREHGFLHLEDIEMACLELDGTMSVVPINPNTQRLKHPRHWLKK